MSAVPASVDDVAAGLRAAGYLPGDSTALVSQLPRILEDLSAA